jgi:hypothetical protein
MITNDDDWIDLFELTTNWSGETSLWITTDIYGGVEDCEKFQMITTLFRQILRRLGYKITAVVEYCASGNEPLERTIYTNLPSEIFHSKRNTLYKDYKRKIYNSIYQSDIDGDIETDNNTNDNPV